MLYLSLLALSLLLAPGYGVGHGMCTQWALRLILVTGWAWTLVESRATSMQSGEYNTLHVYPYFRLAGPGHARAGLKANCDLPRCVHTGGTSLDHAGYAITLCNNILAIHWEYHTSCQKKTSRFFYDSL